LGVTAFGLVPNTAEVDLREALTAWEGSLLQAARRVEMNLLTPEDKPFVQELEVVEVQLAPTSLG